MVKIKDCMKELGYRPAFCKCSACRINSREFVKNICNNPISIPLKYLNGENNQPERLSEKTSKEDAIV